MKTKDFFGKFVNGYLLGNLLAMALVIGALCLGVKYGLEWYTHHGEGIKVPKIEGMSFTNARTLILEDNLNIMVADSGYNKKLPANCILAQNPGPGTMVKAGHGSIGIQDVAAKTGGWRERLGIWYFMSRPSCVCWRYGFN